MHVRQRTHAKTHLVLVDIIQHLFNAQYHVHHRHRSTNGEASCPFNCWVLRPNSSTTSVLHPLAPYVIPELRFPGLGHSHTHSSNEYTYSLRCPHQRRCFSSCFNKEFVRNWLEICAIVFQSSQKLNWCLWSKSQRLALGNCMHY